MFSVFKVSCSVDVYDYDDGDHDCSNWDDCDCCDDTNIQEKEHFVKAQSAEQAIEFIKKMYENMSSEYLTTYNVLYAEAKEVSDLKKLENQEVLSALAE